MNAIRAKRRAQHQVFRTPIAGLLGAIQGFAAGLLWSAIAAGVLPILLRGPSPVSRFSAFAIGVATMIGVRWLLKRETNLISEGKRALVTVAAGVAVGGLLLGLGMLAGNRLQRVLSAATIFEVLFLGSSVSLVLSTAGASRARVVLTNIALAFLFLSSVLAGSTVASFFYGVSVLLLLFAAGALLFFVTDEFLVRAQRRLALQPAAMFCFGFFAALVMNLIP